MKGLFIKELYVLRGIWRTMLIVGGVFVVIGLLGKSGDQLVEMLSGLCIMVSLYPAITSFSQDTSSGWDAFALSMPLGRRKLVGVKYLLCLCSSLAGPVVGLTLCLICGRFRVAQTGQETLITMGVLLLVALLLQSLFLPLIYRFGMERARLLFMGICLFPSLFAIFGAQSDWLGEAALFPVGGLEIGIGAAAVLGIFGLSYLISLRVFSRKEL